MQSDKALMQMICEGSHSAFTVLVQRHTQQFFGLASRTLHDNGDAEDVVQTAFVKLWQNPKAWNSEKSKFTTWFYRVVLNACHDFRRKNQRSTLTDSTVIEKALEPVSSEQALLQLKQETTDQEQRLQSAIARLPSAQKDAINLVVYCALPQKQAAEVLGLSLKALESSLLRAKRNLIKTMAESETAQQNSVKAVENQ